MHNPAASRHRRCHCLRSDSQGGPAAGMYFTLKHTDSIWSCGPLNHLREEMFNSLCLRVAHVKSAHVRGRHCRQISMTWCGRNGSEPYRCVRNQPCMCARGIGAFQQISGLFIVGLRLHEKFSVPQPENHQSTPQTLSWCTASTAAKHKHTTATILLLLQPPLNTITHTQALTHIHTESLSLFLCCFVLSPPLWQPLLRGREERKGEGGDGGEGRPDHPALMAGLSVYIAVAHSVIHLAF